jgi:bifunctional DNA-binding transcriptional regulator/antitoxin component of YhaV-PrlF toxin-antitoxin module
MKLRVNNGRFWIPLNYLKNACVENSDFVNIKIRKGNKIISFISKISEKDKRITIPKNERKILQLKKKDFINVTIKKIKNEKRTKKFIKHGKIDLLSFVPMKTLKGYEILACIQGSNLLLWYYSEKGRPKEIILKRFSNLEIARFLGYLQAEGNKIPRKIPKRRGLELSFTNKSLSMILDFLNLSRLIGLSSNDWNAQITYNINFSIRKVNKQKKLFSKLTSIPLKNIGLRSSDRVKEFTYKLWISTTILFEVVNAMMNKMRKYLINNYNKMLLKYFTQGLLAGDGNFNYYKKKSLHIRLSLFESNKEFIEDYSKLLEKFELKGKIRKVKNKNLYVLDIPINWNELITIFKNDLLVKSPENYKKLIESFNLHQKTKTHSYLILFKSGKSLEEFKNLVGWKTSRAKRWLMYRRRDGMIRKANKKYFLTKKGLKIVNILIKLDYT